ncbi:hypothetical protein DKX38_024366 [Salix brachista]|uniref:Uncharacterized protein n=1 Tax=Salix brachista TaxID=2182728 RepID=A0A5N5JYY8_9ROSI|nr:hypothetical protein DKX38_024366 [Salix brachista]
MPLVTMLLSMNIGLVSGRCQSDQQSLLLNLKKTLVFYELASTKLVKWNSTPDCCEWPGIACDDGGSGRVISLDLSFEGITGGLDDSSGLFSLQFLQNLNLSFNGFSTTLPVRFANLTDLISLNLSNAWFIGQIPNDISKLTKLVSLDLSTNSFFGPALKLKKPNLATLVQNLAQLEELILDGVDISAQGSDWCKALSSSLPNLKVLSMSNCFLSGPLDASLAELRSLSIIRLSRNNLAAPVPEFLANYPKLTALELGLCQLNGIFPQTVFQIPTLEILDLSFNELLQGSFPEFHQNLSLQTLLLIDTNFSGTLPQSIGNLEKLSRIELVGNNFTGTIPSSVANLTQLFYLDLSSNKFEGRIPSFRRSEELTYVDLSRNNLTGEIPSGHWEGLLSLTYVDLRYNAFNGSIPSSLFAIPSMQRIQLSNNLFGGQIPEFPNVSSCLLDTLDFSSNKLEGPIPSSVFDLANLNVLDLSSNKLNGTVELHLVQKLRYLTVDLSYNNLTVIASGKNSNLSSLPQIQMLRLASCNLRVFPYLRNQSKLFHLDLSDNQITGPVPGWISELSLLQYLNLSRNLLVGLERPLSLPNLSFLDLHRNQLQGSIPVPPLLIAYVDYSSNNLSSYIPPNIGMMEGENRHLEYINYELVEMWERVYYQDSITVTFKGRELELVKILTVFTSADFSNNNFEGPIPEVIGQFKALYVLNLSHNALTDHIPPSFGNLSHLESLDLSSNQLTGQIPPLLARLSFLSVLNLSYNRLEGPIPTGSQMQTFSADSFEGNQGLCGPPSNLVCFNPLISACSNTNGSISGIEIDWNFLSAELGYIFGLGIVILPLMFCKRWRTCMSFDFENQFAANLLLIKGSVGRKLEM